jgi:hypothetical protein
MGIYKKELIEEHKRVRGVLHTLEVLGEQTRLIDIYRTERDALGRVIRKCESQEAETSQKALNLANINKAERELLIAFADWVFEQPLSLGGRERELVQEYLKSKQ